MRVTRLAAWVVLAAFPLAAQQDTSPRLLEVGHDGRVGFINTAGRIVIPPQFDVASVCVPGMVLVQRAGKWGFIDVAGRPLIPLEFDDANCFAAGLAGIRVGAKWGFIDRTGRRVIEPAFDGVGWYSEGLAAVRIGDRWGFIDTAGTMVIRPQFGLAVLGRFAGGRAWVKLATGGDALIDRTGGIVAGPFEYLSQFTNGLAGVRNRNGDFFFIDSTGRTAIRPQPGARRWDVALSFHGGRAPVKIGEKWGYIDTTGAVVIEPRFENAAGHFADGRAAVVLGHKWGYIDTTGAVVIEPRFDSAEPFSEGMAVIEVDGNWGYIDTAGGFVIEPRYFLDMGGGRRHRSAPSARGFSEGLAAVRTGTTWGYINRAGAFVIAPQFDEAGFFDGGVARVRLGRTRQTWLITWVDGAGRLLWDPRQLAAAGPGIAPLDTSLLAGPGSLVERVAVMVARLEAAEAGTLRVDLPPDQLTPQLDHAAAQLGRHLEASPDDVRALILSARLARLRDVLQPMVWSAGDPVPTVATLASRYAPHHAALDRALALEPDNAEAHYWKGRLYGLGFTWQQTLYGLTEPPDSEISRFQAYGDSAVRFGRRATELAPSREDYRDALATYLVLSWRDDEVMTLLRDVAGGRHPLFLLLSDWKSLPLPHGAVLRRGESRTLGQMVGPSLGAQDYPALRVRVYVVALPMDSVEASYRARWPGFRFHELESEESDGAARSYVQFVRWRDHQVIVARNAGEIPDQPTEGIAFALVEVTSPTPEARERYGMPAAPVFSVLTLINARRFEAR